MAGRIYPTAQDAEAAFYEALETKLGALGARIERVT